MSSGFHKRDDCRLCSGKNVELAVPMSPTPIADAYVTKDLVGEPQPEYPLDLYFCHGCGHVQLLDVVDPKLMFKDDYTFLSGASAGIVKHFSEYVARILEREKPSPGSLVVDIGSNDGTFLRFFKDAGMNVLGIDPASSLANSATASGIETWCHFLGKTVAAKVRQEKGPARIVTANNVFAHADDLAGMADSIQTLLAPDGVFVFEVSYLLDVVDKMLLGTIFHEHLCYHSVKPLAAFLLRHGMELIDVERVSVQGGSMIGTAQLKGGPRVASPRIDEMIREEMRRGFDRIDPLREFTTRIDTMKGDLEKLFSTGGSFAGYGASRGGTTLLYRLGLDHRLAFICDDSPAKQNLFSPGDHVPILSSQVLYEKKPDYVFILAWVHWKAIVESNRRYLDQGGRFIVAHPGIQVVSKDGIHG